MAEVRMTWKVRGAVKLYDGFTGRPPSLAALRVYAEEGLSVIKKLEGILVFVENRNFKERDAFSVKIESPIYVTEFFSLPLGERPRTLCLRLSPREGYPAPGGTTRLYGHTWPGAKVSFCFSGGEGLKLLADVEEAREEARRIKLYHPGRRSLEGFWVELEAGGYRERFLLGEPTEEAGAETKCYRVERSEAGRGTEKKKGAAAMGFPRSDTASRLVYRTQADEDGRYMLFFKGGEKTEGMLYLETEETWESLPAALTPGEGVRLDGTIR